MIIKRTILGKTFEFESDQDHVLQWGIYVPYVQSENPEEHVVLKEFIFWSARIQSEIIIPRFFLTDLASIPKIARVLISKSGKSKIPALPHDFLYCIHPIHEDFDSLDRKTKDLILKDFCEQQQMASWRIPLVYSAVRSFGWTKYNDDNKQMFCPEEHKDWYLREYDYLNLDRQDGDYIIV